MLFSFVVSYQNPGLNYATAQKLVAVPYTQAAYRPYVAPTPATAASSYTNAYVQPTGVAPVKVKMDFLPDEIQTSLIAVFYHFSIPWPSQLAIIPRLHHNLSTNIKDLRMLHQWVRHHRHHTVQRINKVLVYHQLKLPVRTVPYNMHRQFINRIWMRWSTGTHKYQPHKNTSTHHHKKQTV